MNTLTDLKRLLDEGETICHGEEMIWKAGPDEWWYQPYSGSTVVKIFELGIIADPSLWHQRDQLKLEKPVMMAVPIEQWDALQEELTELRRFKQERLMPTTPDDAMAEQEMESVLFAIFDKNKEAIDNAHYNLMAVGQALVIAKDGSLGCERVKFEGSNNR